MGNLGRSVTALLVLLILLPTGASGTREEEGEVRGPLPRWRLGPDGGNATPSPDENQPVQPYRIALPGPDAAPHACLVASPPEYGTIDGVLVRYREGDFDELVTDLVATLTGDPTKDEVAYVVLPDPAEQVSAEADFTAAGADLSKVRFMFVLTNSVWLRDYGPHFIWQGGADAVVDSHYYPTRHLDNFAPTMLADDHFINPSYAMGLYYSGGNFQASASRDGFVTALIHVDNPELDEPFIAELYREYQGIDTLHILPQLPRSVDGTGHIDMWFYLVDEDTVIIAEFLPGSNPDAIEITDNAVPYMENLGYEVFRVPAFNAWHPLADDAHYTYTNAFRVNDRIFIPTYGEGEPSYVQYDDDAIAAWQQAAGPGVEIVPINSYDIIYAAGAIHCIVKQVPRYTNPVPSACATSPSGGEMLVPGTPHEITWTAADDGTVDTVDLYYSTDGGVTYPVEQTIETGLADTGSYPWTVPEIETGQARVKLIARDDASNPVEAASESDVLIESAIRHVYDFGAGAGQDKFGWGFRVSGWGDLEGVRRPSSVDDPLSASDYAKIAVSDATGGVNDGNRYVGPSPGIASYSAHVFEFVVDEDPAKIVDIGVLWEGFAARCAQMELYVWDHVAGQWCDGRGNCGENRHVDNFAGNRDERLEGHIRTAFDRYIDGTGVVTLLVYTERAVDRSLHDYVSLTVSYDECAGTDTDFDGYADACDNCHSTVNPTQEDLDLDARGDACDCAPADDTAFDVPFEIENVAWLADKTTLVWASDAGNSGLGTRYDVMQGEFDEYPVGSGTGETCAATGRTDPSVVDLPSPSAGVGHYYLVRGSNACGVGSYGVDSMDVERSSTVCP